MDFLEMSLIQINGSRVPGDDVFFESIVLLPSHAMPKDALTKQFFNFSLAAVPICFNMLPPLPMRIPF